MFNVVLSETAYSQLKDLPGFISKRIFEKVNKLSENPLSLNVKKLVNLPFYRLRLGDYRILFELNNKNKSIIIIKVGHRK